MSGFERTTAGQANRALFYGVDWVIYTEGGADSSKPVRAFDSLFWSAIFKAVRPNSKFKAIPRGGKSRLKQLAESVVDDQIQNVLVAMDRDYDDWFGTLIDHPRVLYTFGYSFENDIFESNHLIEIFMSLGPSEVHEEEIKAEIHSHVSSFVASIRWPLKIDLCAKHNKVSGFDRKRPQKYFLSNAYGTPPTTSRDRLVAETDRILAECSDRTLGVGMIPALEEAKVIGHIWEVFAFRLITFLQSRHANTGKLSYDHFRSLGISRIQVRILQSAENDNLSAYYRDAITEAIN